MISNRSRLATYASVLVLLVSIVVIIGAKPVQRTTAKNHITKRANNRLVVHEWGTFTSIAGKNGVALEWKPLNGTSDLPSFVYDVGGLANSTGLRHVERCVKCNYEALVRMETPVIYFYADRETTVSVRVDFSKGKITEWYPQARGVYVPGPNDERNPSTLDWGRITVLPGAEENFPVETKPSHYYPARETDAAPLRVCGVKGEQREKFLFYRGVGTFDQPLTVKLDDGDVVAKNTSADSIPQLILFENRGGNIGYQVRSSLDREIVLDRPTPGQTQESLERDLGAMLVAQGLYEKEALAMIKTWRDSWFEEGLRVFYIVPRKVTDAILPLTIEPQPSELTRVLVGRIEIITPEMEKEIESSLSDSSRDLKDVAEEISRRHGRFAEPVLKALLEKTSDPELRTRIQQIINYSGSPPR
jgi:hypothetical protein